MWLSWFGVRAQVVQFRTVPRAQVVRSLSDNDWFVHTTSLIARFMGPTCWPHEPCYLGWYHTKSPHQSALHIDLTKADSRFVPSQWETSLQSNAVSHRLGANLESALLTIVLRATIRKCPAGSCNTVYPSKTHLKLKSCEIPFTHHLFLTNRIVLNFVHRVQ